MKSELVISLPKTFRQRYGLLLGILCLGVALSVYWRVVDQKRQMETRIEETRRLAQPQLDRMNDRLLDIERDAGKLRALLDAKLMQIYEDASPDETKKEHIEAENLVAIFNRYQGSAVYFKLMPTPATIVQKMSESEYTVEWGNQGTEEYLDIYAPLRRNEFVLYFRININEIVGDAYKIGEAKLYISSKEKANSHFVRNGKNVFYDNREVYIFGNKFSLYVIPFYPVSEEGFLSFSFIMQLLATCLVAGVGHLAIRREHNIRDVVRYRTRELAAANASLAKEIAAHRQAARQMLEGEQQLRAIADALPMAILHLNSRNALQFVNKTATQWLGVGHAFRKEDIEEEPGYEWLLGISPESRPLFEEILFQVSAGESVTLSDERIVFENGQVRYLKIQALPKLDNKYSNIGAYLILTDISDQVVAQENIQRSNESHIILSELGQIALSAGRLDEVFSLAMDQLSKALDGAVVYLAKVRQDQDGFFDIIASSDKKMIGYSSPIPSSAAIQKVLKKDAIEPLVVSDIPLIREDEHQGHVPSLFIPMLVSQIHYGFIGVQGGGNKEFKSYEIYLAQAVGNLISQAILRNKTELTLFNEKERAEVTLASITDAVVTTNQAGLIEFINTSAEKMLGWTRNEVIGQPIQRVMRILAEGSYEYVKNPLEQCLESGEIVVGNELLILSNRYGHERAIDCSAAPLHALSGSVMGGVLVFRDVTSQRQLSNQLSHQATHDALTGLINRFEFERRLNHILSTALGVSSQYNENALLYLDLDQFKVVNDTCGHAAGDALLRQLSALLLQRLRKRDTLARLGGDEFSVLLEHCPPAQAERIANELRQTVRDFRFSWDGKIFRVGVSIGLINFGKHATTLGQLMSAADTACYLAKESGRDRIQISRMNDTPLSEAHQQMNWVSRLQQALEENRFKLFAQEIRALHEKPAEPKHYEILVRLLDESQRMILPGAFIPAAERYNLMTQIDQWVIKESFSWLSQYSKIKDHQEIVLGLNLSGRSLGDETILPIIKNMITEFGIQPGQLCFEITETAAITNMHIASRLIQGLREIGCHFALDDFGSGMSSFGYLKNLPVDYLKIDGNFVKDILQDPIDWVMVESISKVGQAMGLHVIAEYAESEKIIDRLRELGVDYAQGYGIGRPIPLLDIYDPGKEIIKLS